MPNLLAFTIPGGGAVAVPTALGSVTNAAGPLGVNFFTIAIWLIFGFGIVVSIIFLIYGGIMWTTSGGDKQKLDSARKRIVFSIVGLIVIVLAWFIVHIVLNLLGANADWFFTFQ